MQAKNLFVTNAAGTEVAGPVEMEISSTESSASSDSDFKRGAYRPFVNAKKRR